MCLRIHYLDRRREIATQPPHSPTTFSVRSRLEQCRAGLMAWLRLFPKSTSPASATSLEQAEPAGKQAPRPIDQARTVASTACEREAEAA